MPTPRWLARALWILGLLLLIVPRLAYLGQELFNVDEATTAVVAVVILDGGVPYRDAVDQRGPVTYGVFAAIFAVFGRYEMVPIHATLIVVTAAIGLVLASIARRLFGPGAAAWTIFCFGFFTLVSPPWDMLAFHIEWMLILFTCLGFWALLRGLDSGIRAWCVAAGACYALAALSKQPALADAALAVLVLGVAGGAAGRRAALALIAGFSVVAAAAFLYFGIHGALADFWFNYWQYNTRYFLPAIPVSRRIASALLFELPYPRRHAILLVAAFAGAILTVRRARGRPSTSRLPLLLLLAWSVSSYVGAMWSGRNFGHYFIQWLPPTCLLAGLGLDALVRGLAGRWSGHRWVAAAATGAVLLVCAPALFAPDAVLPFQLDPQGSNAYSPTPPSHYARMASEWMEARDPAAQAVFVWGYLPEVYVFSGRSPASRFIFCNFLTGLLPWVNTAPEQDTSASVVPGAWDRLLEDLAQSRPRFIVDTTPGDLRDHAKYPPSAFPLLESILEAYAPVAVLPSEEDPVVRVYERKDEADEAPGDANARP